jgi:hypothetical protein
MSADPTSLDEGKGIFIETCGSGLWSNHKAQVRLTSIHIARRTLSLIVCFDETTWDTKKFGLIYTDPGFRQVLIDTLNSLGIDTDWIDYSEQGAQGSDFVDFDVSLELVESWEKVFGAVTDLDLEEGLPRGIMPSAPLGNEPEASARQGEQFLPG